MNDNYLKLLTGSVLLSALIFTGCGDANPRNSENVNVLQPHQINVRTSSSYSEEVIDNGDEWYKNVSISSIYDRTDENDHKLSLDIVFNQGISSKIKHIHVYMDTDNNANTGFSDSTITGADYLIEDGVLFESKSDTNWMWTRMEKLDYKTTKEANNLYNIKISSGSGALMSTTDIDNIKNLNISIGAVDDQWENVGHFVPLQNVKINVEGGDGSSIVEPINNNPIDQIPVNPDPVEQQEGTLYEDAENGIADWFTSTGQYTPQRRTPGYKNQSQAFVKLKTDWIQLGPDSWKNRSEYHLLMDNHEETILSVDLVGDGEEMHHYILGADVTTTQGVRRLLWDSFYNHENMPAEKMVDNNGITFMIFPSPVEMVRGYGFSDVNLQENFKVDLEAALRQFEPNNEILSVNTFIATGGNLDNIKLLSQ